MVIYSNIQKSYLRIGLLSLHFDFGAGTNLQEGRRRLAAQLRRNAKSYQQAGTARPSAWRFMLQAKAGIETVKICQVLGLVG